MVFKIAAKIKTIPDKNLLYLVILLAFVIRFVFILNAFVYSSAQGGGWLTNLMFLKARR